MGETFTKTKMKLKCINHSESFLSNVFLNTNFNHIFTNNITNDCKCFFKSLMVIRHLTLFINTIQGASTRESLLKILTGGTGHESSDQSSRGKSKQYRIVIDGDSLFYYLYMQKVDWLIGGDGPFFESAIKTFIESLARFNITPVIFVPPFYINPVSPAVELRKGKTRMQYMIEIAKAIEKDSGRSLPKTTRSVQFNPLSYYTFIDALRINKVQFRVTDGPVAPYISSYVKEKSVPVIAYDNVYYAYNIPCYIHCDSIAFKPTDIHARIVWPSVILKELQLSAKQFQLICRLLPSDFYISTALAPFRDMVSEGFSGGANTEERPEGSDVHIQRINALVSYVKNHALTTDDASLNDYAEFFADVQELNAKYYVENKNNYSKNQISGADGSCDNKEPAETNSVEELSPANKANLLEILHESAHMFDSKDYKNSVKFVIPAENSRYGSQSLPDWIETFMKQGSIPPVLIYAINIGLMPLPCGIEAVSGSLLGRTSSCLPARKLRLFTYSLLGLKRINEQFKHGEEWIAEDLNVPPFETLVKDYHLTPLAELLTGKDMSYLEKFPSLTGPVRRELVLLILLDGDSKLLNNLIDRFSKPITADLNESDSGNAPESPSSWHTNVFVIACIIYMLRRLAEMEESHGLVETDRASISSEMLAAILTAAYLPLYPNAEQANPKRSACDIDIHMLTLTSALQFIYEAALMVNSLFGKPLDVRVTTLHRGISHLILYHEEMVERNSQIRKHNKELTDPKTPFYQSDIYMTTEKARQEKNYTTLSKQDKYICMNIERYERLRLALTTLSQDVLPNLKTTTSSPAAAITGLTNGLYILDSDVQTLQPEARFYNVSQDQKSSKKPKKKETTYSFTDLRNNHNNKNGSPAVALRANKGNEE